MNEDIMLYLWATVSSTLRSNRGEIFLHPDLYDTHIEVAKITLHGDISHITANLPNAPVLISILPEIIDFSDKNADDVEEKLDCALRHSKHIFVRSDFTNFNGIFREDLENILQLKYTNIVFRLIALPTPELEYSGLFWIKISRVEPVATLLLSDSNTGKSSYMRVWSTVDNISFIHGDKMLMRIARGELHASDALQSICQSAGQLADWSLAIIPIVESELLSEFLDLVIASSNGQSIMFEMWAPKMHWDAIFEHFSLRNYRVALLSTDPIRELDEFASLRRNRLNERFSELETTNKMLESLRQDLMQTVKSQADELSELASTLTHARKFPITLVKNKIAYRVLSRVNSILPPSTSLHTRFELAAQRRDPERPILHADIALLDKGNSDEREARLTE